MHNNTVEIEAVEVEMALAVHDGFELPFFLSKEDGEVIKWFRDILRVAYMNGDEVIHASQEQYEVLLHILYYQDNYKGD